MLSEHSLFVRRVHIVPASSLHVLRDERDCSVHSALGARHGRLLSTAGRRGEDLAGHLGAARLHRLPANGRRERAANVSQNSRHRYDNCN